MESEKGYKLLAEQIGNMLCEGIELSDNVMHFIDSTFSAATPDEIKKILTNDDTNEKDVLLDLIFYPDESIQIKMENILEEYPFEKNDEKKVHNYLLNKDIKAKILLPEKGGSFKIPVTSSMIEQFIRKLNISKKIDKKITDTINCKVQKDIREILKVKLRNSRFEFTEDKINFLKTFLTGNINNKSTFIECFGFLLNFFEEIKEDDDILISLNKKKMLYIENIKKVLNLSDQLKKKNIEMMIMQNIRIPGLNIPETERKIELIEQICGSI